MRIKIIIWLAIVTLLVFCLRDIRASENKEKSYLNPWALKNLEQEIQRAAELAGGIVGVCALHIETERKIEFNAQERFPMASVYKIPLAVQLLHLVDRGQISLEKMVTLQPQDLRPGSGIIAAYLNKPGVALSVLNLLELMLVLSDNTATDILLRLAGGPQAVTARLRDMGILDMDVSRPTINLIADATGFTLPPKEEWKIELLEGLHKAVASQTRQAAAEKFLKDQRDTSTPEAMVKLLKLIYRENFWRGETKNLLLEIMGRCQTGKHRLKGILLPQVAVAHKTGTIAGVINDAGLITLPNNAGRIAMAIFIKSSTKDISLQEQAIAHISRAIYDFFLFNYLPPKQIK